MIRLVATALICVLAFTGAIPAASAQTVYEVRQESAPGANDFDSQPLLGTVTPYDGSTQTAEAYYNRSSGPPYSWQGTRPTYSDMGTDQTSLFFVETSEGLALMTVMAAMSQSNSNWQTTTSGPFTRIGVTDDPSNNNDSFVFAAGTLTASGRIGANFGDGHGLIVDEGSPDPIFFELDSGTNGFDSNQAGLRVLADDGSGGNTIVTAVLEDNRRLRLAPVAMEIATKVDDAPGWRLLSAPVGGLDVLDLAAINLVLGVPGGATNASQFQGAGYPTTLGLAGNLFHEYRGVTSVRNAADTADSTVFVYAPVPDTDYTFEAGRGIWWYWYDDTYENAALQSAWGVGIGQSYDLVDPNFELSASGPVQSADVNTAFPLASVLPDSYDGDGDGVTAPLDADETFEQGYFYMGGNPFSQPFSVDGITATNGTVQALVYTWDPTANGGEGNHVPLARSGFLDGTGDAAAVWQGFMVEVTPTSGAIAGDLGPTLTYARTAIQANTTPPFYGLTASSGGGGDTALGKSGGSQFAPRFHFTLAGTTESGRVSEDQAWLRLLPDAADTFGGHDASKFSNSPAQIAFPIGNRRNRRHLGVNSRPDGTTAALPSTIRTKLDLKAEEAGTFTLTWTADVPAGWRAILVDREANRRVNMSRHSEYTFDAEASEWTSRFIVRLKPPREVTSVAPEAKQGVSESLIGQPYPNPAASSARLEVVLAESQSVRLDVYDALGREVAVVHDDVLSAGVHNLTLPVRDLPAGLYILRITGDEIAETRRLTVTR